MNSAFNRDQKYWRSRKGPVVNHTVSEPEFIGYYSVDGDRNYVPDSSRLSYYNPPSLGQVYMDLNEGLEKAVTKSESTNDGRINHLLEWIKRNNAKILSSRTDKWIEPEFVCSCGLLGLVLCTPFKPSDNWIICAAKWRGTIYLCRFKTPKEQEYHDNLPQESTSWGFKFEQYIVSAHPDEAPDTSRPVVEPAEFRCILKRRFGRHNVLFSAEMDAVCSKTILNDPLSLENLKFIELKTKKMIEHDGQEKSFRKYHLIRWWAQSFVTGIEDILCGFRDDNGIVRKLTHYSLDQIVKMCRSYWNPQDCINYCEQFLTLVARTVVEDCDKSIYKFEKIPNGQIITSKVSPTSSYSFIPSSFLAKSG